LEAEDEATLVVVVELEPVVAADASFLGFGAGGGGRLLTAVKETSAHHITFSNIINPANKMTNSVSRFVNSTRHTPV